MVEHGIEARRSAAGRPQHLVLFADGADIEQALAASTGAPLRRGSERAGTRLLEAPDGRAFQVFDALGIAAGDLDERERALLGRTGAIEGITANGRRTLSDFLVEEAPRARGRAPAPPGGPAPEALTAYVRGMRDAMDLVLGQLEGGQELRAALAALGAAGAAGAAGAPTGGQTWCLDLLGLGEGARYDGGGVVVAVLDTGVDPDHPDLAHLFAGGAGLETFVGGTPRDGNGHGTHAIGVIAGAARPRVGPRYGVAPGATVLSGKVLDDAGAGHDDQILAGIAWAAARGAHIISTSFGSPRPAGARFAAAYDWLGQRLARRGVLLVAAAGNGSRRAAGRVAPVADPAACPAWKAVAAIDRGLAVAPFSSSQLDYAPIAVAAPGVAVRSAWPGGGYRLLSGTSMAAPHVAGAAALWWQRDGRSAWCDLLAAASDLGAPLACGAGLVRVPEARPLAITTGRRG